MTRILRIPLLKNVRVVQYLDYDIRFLTTMDQFENRTGRVQVIFYFYHQIKILDNSHGKFPCEWDHRSQAVCGQTIELL